MKKKMVILAALALSGSGSVAAAADKEKVRVFLNGAFNAGSLDFSQSRTFKEFAEEGRVDTQYNADSGLGFELGLHWRFKARLGAALSVSGVGRDSTVSYSASLPHPFFLDRARKVSGSQDGLSYHETAVHLDFVYAVRKGSLEITLLGGPSLVNVKTDLATALVHTEAYPYDEVNVTAVTLTEASDSAFGFNLGGGLDYRLGRTFGLGAQVRYTIASPKLVPPEGPTIEINGGGFQAAAGVRVFF